MKRYDLVVVGAGLSGVAASISAAREGLKVLLIEKAGMLGGAMSNSFVYPFMPYWMLDKETNEKKMLCGGLFRKMLNREKELCKYAGVNGSGFEDDFGPEMFKFVLDNMICEARCFFVKEK